MGDANNSGGGICAYTDYAHITEADDEAIEPMLQMGTKATDQPMKGPSGGQHNDRYFPSILHYALSELEADGMSDIVSWQPHGRCFLVHKSQEFTDKVLCRWFRQTKYASFQRQLNLYGFHRITSGPDKHSYYHEYFLRGKPFLTRRIQRMKTKGTGPRRPGCPQSEPNFYSMKPLPPTEGVRNSRTTVTTYSCGQPSPSVPQRLLAAGSAMHKATPMGGSFVHAMRLANHPRVFGNAPHDPTRAELTAYLHHQTTAPQRAEHMAVWGSNLKLPMQHHPSLAEQCLLVAFRRQQQMEQDVASIFSTQHNVSPVTGTLRNSDAEKSLPKAK